MDAYERMVNAMRKAGAHYNAPSPQIGVMSGRGKIKIDTMELEPDDYLINSTLRLDDKEKMYFHSSVPESGQGALESSHNATLNEYKNNVLQVGDRVLLQKLSGFEKYVVIAKVVDAK